MTPYENFTKEYEETKNIVALKTASLTVQPNIETLLSLMLDNKKQSYISALEGAITILQERQTFFTDTFKKTEHTMSGLIANTYKTDIENLKEQIELITNHN